MVRKSPIRAIPQDQAKRKVIDLIAGGAKVADAMRAVGRTSHTWKDWKNDDPEFRAEVEYLRALAERAAQEKGGDAGSPVPDFPEFCAEYLHQPLYEHQLRMWDVLRGKEPRNLHPSMVYRKGRPARLLVNFPPDHAKTTTWTINYVVWLIHRNPDVRVVIVSKTLAMAKKMLGAIKFRLTDPSFREMHLRFAPEGGWKDPDQSWTTTEIYVKGRGSGEKDPTVQALGIGGHLQGARSDVIILDDVVDRANAALWEDQADWLAQIVTSRLPDDDEDIPMAPDSPGKLLIFGTRNAPVELYQKLRDEFMDYDGNPIYTYFAQPAVLEYAEDPVDWVTLWPSIRDRHGNVKRKWDGRALAKRRGDVRSEALWALTFQQADVAENATFPAGAVHCAVNGARLTGRMPEEGPGASRGERGMRGLHVVAGLDPATVGHTAMVVYGVDRETKKRYVLDAVNRASMSPAELRTHVKRLTKLYGIREWRVEMNAYQKAIIQDDELRFWLANAGCLLRGHYTTAKNKFDADFGVQGLAPLFLSCGTVGEGDRWRKAEGGGLIELPNAKLNPAIAEMLTQFITWIPEAKNQKTDLVMAMWFAEIAAREYLGIDARKEHWRTSPFTARHDLSTRRVVNLNELAESLRSDW
jgi:hypothetical protein